MIFGLLCHEDNDIKNGAIDGDYDLFVVVVTAHRKASQT